MDEKRKLIVKEIKHWRRNKLLPEQYCDFLLNLYNDDEQAGASESGISMWNASPQMVIRHIHWKFWAILGFLLSMISFIVFNFNSFPIEMQIAVSVFIVFICYLCGYLFLNRRKNLALISFGTGSFFMLFIGPYMLQLYEITEAFWVIGYVVLCSFIWIILGILTRLGVFQFCGWAGLVLFYAWLLHARMDEAHWLQIQLYWIPLTVLFIWFGWLLHHRKKTMGNVYLLIGTLVWFVPDIYLNIVSETDYWLQFSFIGKMILAGLILFISRKKWTEWVA